MSFVKVSVTLSAVLVAGCYVPRESTPVDPAQACTRCHGDSSREGDATAKAAPPFDSKGNTDVASPGVGAHAQHLARSSTHAAVECTECHVVPKTPMDDGHNVGKTSFTFGALANGDAGLTAAYDFDTHTCTNSCHRGTESGHSDDWTAPAENACGHCHGLPPKLTAAKAPHPQAGSCSVCHADVIAADGGIINPDLHVDGTVEVSKVACNACHGQDDAGNPPRALDGSTDRTSMGVGAHVAHLSGGKFSKPVACETCHVVPDQVVTASHPNGGHAEVKASVAWDRTSATCTNNCHGAPDAGVSPMWNVADANITCASCHGAPPPAPHPQVTNCTMCHTNTTGPSGRQIVDRSLHGNGLVEQQTPTTCNGCHGSATNPAPPRDLDGGTDTQLLSVGAHQSHLVGHGFARKVECNECHVVPTKVITPTHTNGTVEVVFSGVGTSWGAVPAWNAATGTCTNAACHDTTHLFGSSGAYPAPKWTQVDGSLRACYSCHGLPPAAPHPQQFDCSTCHTNVTNAYTFIDPTKHINGTIDFQ